MILSQQETPVATHPEAADLDPYPTFTEAELKALASRCDPADWNATAIADREAEMQQDAIALDAYHGRVRNFKTAKEIGWDVSAAEYFAKP